MFLQAHTILFTYPRHFLLLVQERKQVRLPLWGAEFLIVTGSMIAMFQAPGPLEAFETLLKDVYMYLFFIIVVNIIEDRGILSKMVKIWQVLALIEALFILFSSVIYIGQPAPSIQDQGAELGIGVSGENLQAVHSSKRVIFAETGPLAPGRQRGTFSSPNLAGLYLGQGAVLTVGIPFTRRRWLHWLMVGVMIAGLVATGSNAALGAFLVAFSAYLLFSSSNHKRLMWLGVGAVGLGLIFGVLMVIPPRQLLYDLAQLSPIFKRGISRAPGGVEGRAGMVFSGWEQFREKPLGLGPHGMRISDVERNTHNEYAAYLFERGYLGFAGLLFLLGGAAARAIYSGLHGDVAHRRLMAALLGVLLMTMVTDLAHEYMREREVWLGIAMIVLFAEFELRRRQSEQRDVRATRWPWASAKMVPVVSRK
jgi:O-antigen ligase